MLDSFQCRRTLAVNNKTYHYFDLKIAEQAGLKGLSKLPFSLKILIENLLRHEDGKVVTKDDIKAFITWLDNKTSRHEIAYYPARVLMQDFTGVPAVVDLAAMRDAMVKMGGNPEKINPLCSVDLVIDHSVQVDKFGSKKAFGENVDIEMDRNLERYTFLKWGQQTFKNFSVVPPGTGICHQVNLEYLAKGIWSAEVDGKLWALPDTLVGTDSHTTMINGLGVLGWGVGGIEAEAAMLGQPISMLIPEVIGFKFTGRLREGITATDLVLTVTQKLREKGVVGKFVEYFGSGLGELPLADRATLANMAPEYGATCGLFPIDEQTIKYLELSGRPTEVIELVKAYSKSQGIWHDSKSPEAIYTDILELDLSQVEPSLAGPKRPQDRVALSRLAEVTRHTIEDSGKAAEIDKAFATSAKFDMKHGNVVIAAITSCTNTSNPSVMLAAGLVAQKAVAKGLQAKPWVKSSLAPGSKVVTDYLKAAGLIEPLEKIGFYLVGYGCTTCIGNSGPLPDPVSKAVDENDMVVCAVLSGNRNFEGRVHPQVRANWLASPPLVVAFALAGTTNINLTKQPIGKDAAGNEVYLKDLWPSEHELAAAMQAINNQMFKKEYAEVFDGDEKWQEISINRTETYNWDNHSTYVQSPPYFVNMKIEPGKLQDIKEARILALLGDSITTDHISPAGSIKEKSPAGQYLLSHGVKVEDFNSYGARRGNHEVMMRGTFANIRIRNEMLNNVEGGYTKYLLNDEQMFIYDAAMKYQAAGIPLVIIAGKEYGAGSSRDWAAKGPLLLGIKAVIAESFERIHRSNLVGMGILPLVFPAGVTRKTLKLNGTEKITITGIVQGFKPADQATLTITRANGSQEVIKVLIRIDTQTEYEYYCNGGILQYMLRNLLKIK